MKWAVYRDFSGALRYDLEAFAPSDGTVVRSGFAGPIEAKQARADLEAAEEHARAVEDGQLDLFGEGE